MPRIYVEFSGLNQIGSRCKSVASSVDSIQSDFQRTVRQLDWDIRFESNINSTATQLSRKLESYSRTLESYQRFIEDARGEYVKLNEYKKTTDYFEKIDVVIPHLVGPGGQLKIFTDEFLSNYGWKEILSGAGYIGTIYNLINDIRDGKSWRDLAKTGVDTYRFLSGAAKTYNNYKKIGNAVGTKTAMAWWAKNITGLKPLGRASTAKNPFTRFANNLTNKTSPFNAQFKNIVNNFKGANGVGKAVASWGTVAVNGVLNWFSNKDEQANSNGTMSDGRVIAETITETVVDTALTYGTGIVVGAAVTAALGTVAAPGIVVVAASGAVVAGLNAGVKALTGKTTTEWISDTILDTGEAIGSAVSNAAKNVSESIGSWFGKLSFT
ncbi:MULTISPECIES: hypothetical protein [Clostridia]|uniref:hypothetical protein n=1 Tax=Clostridia TaxID=186801 RepID=UPI00262E3B2A|nr:hypothetical protein [Blautia sp.]